MWSFKRARPAILALMLLTTVFLHAQEADGGEEEEEDGGVQIESDWSRTTNLYTRGDQTFNVSLGLVLPIGFVDQNAGVLEKQMNLGGMLSLSYNYFLSSNWFLGGELGGMFASTLGENMYYIVPIGFRAGYQFILSRFEFPLSLLIGFAPQSYNGRSYFGFFSKPSAGVFFRLNPSWSFGLNTSLWWVPQWTNKTRELNYQTNKIHTHGFFWEIGVMVRYHF